MLAAPPPPVNPGPQLPPPPRRRSRLLPALALVTLLYLLLDVALFSLFVAFSRPP